MKNYYSSSPLKLLSTVFPEYEWLPWKFGVIKRDFWHDVKNQRKFMEFSAKELNIKEMSDWYQVKLKVTWEIASDLNFRISTT
jgi:hypothetical protein